MKLLMLSRDPDILREHSEVRARMIEYGSVFKELHIVVLLGRKNQNASLREVSRRETKIKYQNDNAKCKIAKNVFVHSATFISAFRVAVSAIHASHFTPHDFLTAQDPFELGLIAVRLKRKFKIPLQLQVHTDFLSPYFGRESFKNRVRVMIAKWLIKKADSVRVVSERIKRALTTDNQQLTTKIITLPIFVDIQKIKKTPVAESLHQKYPGRFIILMASRLTREKNIPLALEAMRLLKREALVVRPLLVIVGDGPMKKNLQLTTNNLQLKDRVIFESKRDDLVSYYKTADLFLLTSNYEGYGRTAVEAAAAGLPVIMTDVGCAGEFIKDAVNGFVIPTGDRKALTEKLGAILKNPKLLESLRRTSPPDLPSKKEYLVRYEASFHNPKS